MLGSPNIVAIMVSVLFRSYLRSAVLCRVYRVCRVHTSTSDCGNRSQTHGAVHCSSLMMMGTGGIVILVCLSLSRQILGWRSKLYHISMSFTIHRSVIVQEFYSRLY